MGNLLKKWFQWKLGKARIERSIEKSEALKYSSKSCCKNIRAAAVQRRITTSKSVEAYARMMESFVKSAAEQNCDIIIFPEYNFFELIGVIPGFGLLNRCLNSRAPSSAEDNSTNGIYGLYPLLCSISVPIQAAIEQIMRILASKYQIYIYTGSYFIEERGYLYNGGAVISREGNILGHQMKLHLTDFEEKLGIKRGSEFKVFPLDIGNIAFPVCMDATYYEVFNLARSRGCDIVALPIANSEEYSTYRALRGIWPRVQEAHAYGIKSALNGWFCGMHFTGKAGIFAPLAITPREDGVIAISEHPEGDSLIVGEIDIEALYKERKVDEYYGDCNPEFEKDYYMSTYSLRLKY